MEEKSKVSVIKLPNITISSILWIVLGAVLLVFPGQSLDLICRIAGILVLIVGAVQIVLGCTGKGTMPGQLSLTTGIIIALVGLFIVLRPDIIVSVLPFVAGMILILHCGTSLVSSFQLAGAKYGYWWVGVLLSILGMVLGFILFFNAHSTAAFIARIIGLFMLYAGASSLWVASRKAHAAKVKRQEEEALDVEAKIIEE